MTPPKPNRRRPTGPGGCVLWSVLLLLALPPLAGQRSGVAGQSIVGGTLEGVVQDEAGVSVRGALVTLLEGRSGAERATRTPTDGTFDFAYVAGGAYQLRVEALGYRPVVVMGLAVAQGERTYVAVTLVAELPPLTRVDTVRYPGGGRSTPGLAHRIDWRELSTLPDRSRDLTGILTLSTVADAQGGLEGLPARYTTLFVDGEPVRTAWHPSLGGGGGGLGFLLPRIGLQSATVRTGLEDIEWSGATGGIVALENHSAQEVLTGEAFGLWSGGPVWNNEVVGEGPALLSAWGGGTLSFPVAEGGAPISLSVEGATFETPNLFWRNDYFARKLVSGAPEPGLTATRYVSGVARGGWNVGDESQLTARASFSTFKRESDRPGVPRAGYAADVPGDGTDGSVSALLAMPLSNRLLMELRGTASLSSRTWGDPDTEPPGVFLVGERALVGTDPSYPATSDRFDFSISPVFHYRSGANRIKGGGRVEVTSHDMRQADQSNGAYFFGSVQNLQAGRGNAIAAAGGAGGESFLMSSGALFGQYWWAASPRFEVTTGISAKIQKLPMPDIQPSTEWLALTGVSNVSTDELLSAVDGRIHVRWDMAGDGRTWFVGAMGLEHGGLDPAALYEVLSMDGDVSARRFLGEGLSWSADQLPTKGSVSGTRLALFAGGLEMPRTARGAIGFYHALGSGIRIGAEGSVRRTEAVLRRTDLNRLRESSGTDQDGRPLFGDLRLVGGVLAGAPETNRRFPGFESVWALNPDGWSEYRGATVSVESSLRGGGALSVAYTWSETTDNLVGSTGGGALAQIVPELPVEKWDEAPSDLDIPHRLSALLSLPLPWGAEVTGVYTLRSDLPFTPRVAAGLDANGDGSPFNDVAYIPASGGPIEALAREWDCIAEALGSFAERNSCRGDPVHLLSLRLSVQLPPVGGLDASLVLDGINLTDADMGLRDDNLLLLGSGGLTKTSSEVEVPYRVNPGFGGWVYRGDTGRMLRLGLKIGGSR